MEPDWMVGYKYWHEIGMHDNFMFGWWNMILVPWPSRWELMVVPYGQDVIQWISWWDLMVVPH